jgi:deacetoxycephalosporin-C synthase/deacetoxycephalosporin-C hydroxylase
MSSRVSGRMQTSGDEALGEGKEQASMARAPVPVISLAELRRGLHREELRRCVTEQGLFYLTEYGVSDEDHRLATDAAMDVFEHSTPEEQQALATKIGTIRRGYSGLGTESTARSTNIGEYSDYAMAFSMGLSNNLFPSPRFEQVWTDYFDRLHGVALEVARAVLGSTGTCDGGYLEALLDCDPVLRLRYFPEVPEHRVAEREPLRMAPHYDLSIITLIHQTPCANGFVSLRAELADGLVDLPVVPDAVVVLCGAVATLVTLGAVPAPRHHVAAPPADLRVGSDRTSSVFFLRPSPTFAFSVPRAREYGLDVSLAADTATFGEWVGTNYIAMHALPGSPTP